MAVLRVAVGSLRTPKLNAVRSALELCKPRMRPNSSLEIVGFDVASGVRPTPLSREETMQGARRRTEALRQVAKRNARRWDYFVGLEGGVEVVVVEGQRRVFLESWIYVEDAAGRGEYGQSGAIPMPTELASAVVDEGTDLSEAIDAYAGCRGIRNGLGAWGVLTRGLITREDAFRIATINAFAPFFVETSSATQT